MRSCAIAAIAVWAASSAAASAADVSAGGPAVGYGLYAYSPRIEPLTEQGRLPALQDDRRTRSGKRRLRVAARSRRTAAGPILPRR